MVKRIVNKSVVVLSINDQRLLIDTIRHPPKPNEALRKAFEAHKRLIIESR